MKCSFVITGLDGFGRTTFWVNSVGFGFSLAWSGTALNYGVVIVLRFYDGLKSGILL